MDRSFLLPLHIASWTTIVFLLIAPRVAFAQEYSRVTTTGDESGHELFWRDRLIGFVIDAEGCPDTDMGHTRAAVINSFNTWESLPCTDLFFSFEGYAHGVLPNHFTGESDGYNLIIWLREWPPEWGERRLAHTRIIWNERTGEILDVDIVMNAQDYYWTSSDRTVTDIQNVLTHEIGHLLGFGHTNDPEATMYDGYSEGEDHKRDLSGTDIRGVCEVYPAGEPTPGIPDQGVNNPELASGCQCAAASPSSRSIEELVLLAFLLGLGVLAARRGRRS